MTNKMQCFGSFLIIPLITVTMTAFTISPANALVTRDFSYLHDNHCTALYNCAGAQICGDYVCSPGEYGRHLENMSKAEIAQGAAAASAVRSKSFAPAVTSPPVPNVPLTPSRPNVSPTFELSNANLPLVIPLVKGLYDGKDVFYISTDTSDSNMAAMVSKFTNFPVNFAPSLAKTPPVALANMYVFKNGIKGSGAMGYQPEVFDAIPTELKYSPLWKVNYVEWNDPTKATVLGSDDDILSAQQNGVVTVTATSIVCNSPIVQWDGDKEGTVPAGHVQIRNDTTLTDTTAYGGGQVLDIDTQKMQVTFVAHRGFGPDGSTIYYIVTDTTMSDPAKMMGVILANKTQATFLTSSSSDLYQFGNGINGTGPMGFQAGIGSTKPGDQFYSPMWRISAISWNDPSSATILENSHDITSHSDQIKITSMNMVVNCPFFSVDTIFAHMK
ncbi:MAG: hypothetical protein KGI27_13125 [Thaumarchaeota archaeon]|nr:hypothetical protein [Nitrososphaerota archaeon]